jgi:hypothetical protein
MALFVGPAFAFWGGPRGNRLNRGSVTDYIPTTIASQGAFAPLLIGRRRIGSVFAWAGNRTFFQGRASGTAKGRRGRPPRGPKTYSESGWHVLAVGPAWQLHKIYVEGKVVWEGPIDRDTSPSGTTVTMASGEEFRVYWGETDQPVDADLADFLGVESNWPYLCYIFWVKKGLGSADTTHWPNMEYDLETQPTLGLDLDIQCGPDNAAEVVWEDAGEAAIDTALVALENIGSVNNVVDFDENTFNVVTGGYYRIYQNNPGGQDIQIQFGHSPLTHSPAATWQRFKISLDGVTMWELLNFGVIATPGLPGDEDCWPYSEVLGPGSLRRYSIDEPEIEDKVVFLTAGMHTIRIDTDVTEDGTAGSNEHYAQCRFYFKRVLVTEANPISQILFAPMPHGLGLDTAHFDLDSLQDVWEEIEAEGVDEVSVLASEKDAVEVLADLMTDLGIMLYRDPITAKLTFRTVRQQTAVAIPEDLDIGASPEISFSLMDRPASRLIYTFPDQAREHRDTVITIDEDGQGDYLALHRAKKLRLESPTTLSVATKIAERRSQEELAGRGKFSLQLSRDARLLKPGDVISLTDVEPVLRVLEVEPETRGPTTKVEAVVDYYGAETSGFTPDAPAGTPSPSTDVDSDSQKTILELPAFLLLPGEAPSIVIPRVRANEQTIYADLHISRDDTTYIYADREFELQTGGTLIDAIPASTAYRPANSYTFTLAGPDADIVNDYSTDETNWTSGRQLCLIDDELFFLQKITSMGGAVYRLDGLIRARYDTRRALHAIGAKVYIFSFTEITPLADPLIAPGELIYAKTQPWVGQNPSALGTEVAVSRTLYGKGTVPIAVSALRVTAPYLGVAAYGTGEDVDFTWGYSSMEVQGTGAGMQGAGTAVGESDPEGSFEIEVYDLADVLQATYNVTASSWTYTNAQIVADLGAETDFYISVKNVRGGYKSNAKTLTVEAI